MYDKRRRLIHHVNSLRHTRAKLLPMAAMSRACATGGGAAATATTAIAKMIARSIFIADGCVGHFEIVAPCYHIKFQLKLVNLSKRTEEITEGGCRIQHQKGTETKKQSSTERRAGCLADA